MYQSYQSFQHQGIINTTINCIYTATPIYVEPANNNTKQSQNSTGNSKYGGANQQG